MRDRRDADRIDAVEAIEIEERCDTDLTEILFFSLKARSETSVFAYMRKSNNIGRQFFHDTYF